MAKRKKQAASWRVPDELWERVEPLLPKYRTSKRGGRPRVDPRRVLDGILYVLRTGCQWKEASREFGAPSTLHQYFQEWTERGVFFRLWKEALWEYDALEGIDWGWQSLDGGAMTKAPLGGEKTGSNPTDRAKSGTKCSLLTDGDGVPLALAGGSSTSVAIRDTTTTMSVPCFAASATRCTSSRGARRSGSDGQIRATAHGVGSWSAAIPG
jgi:transposase